LETPETVFAAWKVAAMAIWVPEGVDAMVGNLQK
jgi:hypothetical protein